MPTSLTITVKYADGTIEVFTNCIVTTDTDTKIVFTGSLSSGPATDSHKILLGPGMRVTQRLS